MNKFFKFIGIAICLLSINSQAAVWDPSVTMVFAEEVAPGVFVVQDADNPVKNETAQSSFTSAGFIIGEKGILVVDTYVNARTTGQLIGLIRKESDLPILYAVNTSYHGDHMYGNYLFPNALIIQHEATKDYINNKWEGDIQFMTNQFGKNKGIEENVPRAGDIILNNSVDYIEIDLGGKVVEIHRFGFGQTEGDLQVYVPEDKIFWVGNPVVAEAPITPWLLEGGHIDSLITLRKIRDFLPEDATVVPGHGRPFKMDYERNGLLDIIDYIETLDRLVRESVEKGMGFRETAREVQMRDHRASGYELYNWTHFQLNLPCTYLHYYETLGKGSLDQTPTQHCLHKNVGEL